jgi:Zn-dependent peptidase ImmA (M78 family)
MFGGGDAFMSLEKSIEKWYLNLGIDEPEKINLQEICDALSINVIYLPFPSRAIHENRSIVVDTRLPLERRREQHAHELAHILLHCGGQAYLPHAFVEKQEWQANNVAAAILAPFFLIKKILSSGEVPQYQTHAVHFLARRFRVTATLMRKRLYRFIQFAWNKHSRMRALSVFVIILAVIFQGDIDHHLGDLLNVIF